ncbi:hypothetical protein O4H49_20470, partial [Kiloniella laminariae]
MAAEDFASQVPTNSEQDPDSSGGVNVLIRPTQQQLVGGSILNGLVKAKSYIDTLPTEEVGAAMLALQVAMGPVKGTATIAANLALDAVAGDKIDALKQEISFSAISALTGYGRDLVEEDFIAGRYNTQTKVEATEFLIFTVLAGTINLKRSGNDATRKFTTKIDDKIVDTEYSVLPEGIAKTFKNAEYATAKTIVETPVYRKFGGSDSQAKANGGFVTTERNLGRDETAVYPKWNNTRFEAEIIIPKGTQIHIGRVAPQPIGETNPKYRGGADQVLLPRDYPDSWIKTVKDGKTGTVYSLDQFKAKFPNQFN